MSRTSSALGFAVMGSTLLGMPTVRMPALMECLTQRGVIEAQITRHRVDMASWSCLDALDGLLDLVE